MYTEYRIRLDQERKEYIEIQSRVTATFCCFFFYVVSADVNLVCATRLICCVSELTPRKRSLLFLIVRSLLLFCGWD